MALPGDAVSRAFLDACHLELRALKPGNIGVHGESRGMTVADFERSAEAAAPVMGMPGISVGRRILRAIEATREVVNHNTNLGIALLAAPLAQAALDEGDGDLRARVMRTLDTLSVDDASDAYAAIRLAEPGGLDTVPEQDVRREPTVTLREAMRMADPRDRVALQYVSGFADIFDMGLPFLADAEDQGDTPEWATTALYMHFLAHYPDALIARKYGSEIAGDVHEMAQELDAEITRSLQSDDAQKHLLEFDAWLKARAYNPGATADLVVATLFAARLIHAERPIDHDDFGLNYPKS